MYLPVLPGVILLSVDDAIGQHFLRPQLQGLHRHRDPLQLLLDVDKIVDLIVGDGTVCRDLDEPVFFPVHRV